MVNDGSKDNTLKVLQKLSEEDKRIKVINQVNSGVSQARNNGLKNASGKFIGFVDADDYIDITMYEKMYKKAEEFNCDIVICNVNDVKGEEKKVSLCLEEGVIDMDNLIKEDFLCEKYCKLGTAVWHKIFKTELIKENNIKFINYSEVASEDTLFNFEAMLKAKKIYCLDEPLYNYIIRAGSTMRQKSYNKKLESIFVVLEHLENEFKKRNLYFKYKDELEYIYIEHLLYAASRTFFIL